MRIEAYSRVAQVYDSTKASKTKSVQRTGSRDEVQISQAGRDYQVAKQALAETSDIREDKVEQFKEEIAAGSYKVETGAFAAKLIEKYSAYEKYNSYM